MMDRLQTLKPDAVDAAERMRRWWNGEPTDRVVASVVAPLHGNVPILGNRLDRLTDADTIIHNLRATVENRFWGGEAFPAYWIFPIAMPMSVYLGCEPTLSESTTWQFPIFDSWDGENWKSVRFDPGNEWWMRICELTSTLAEAPDIPYLLSASGLGGISDAMANLWGSETLLMAIMDDPQGVRGLRDNLLDAFRAMYDQLYSIVSHRQEGYFDWLMLWAPGRMCTSQSDISCMMSPSMFSEYFIDGIQEEAQHVDYFFYHLDGPGAIRHLDALLGIDELDGIQWVPGDGASKDPMDWISLFDRIQRSEKKLNISCPPEQVEPLLNSISRRGVYLSISCKTQEIARQTLSTLERIGG